ncbi:galactitol-1-phosphate 5-dehydrogenase [Cohnella sp. CIP 111063]|uniref:alcohol dehydrogenase catalytic domain-containing protein n=1 Tax=unclassified Cohnella TaxID=2636738 RepID=UPI000B8C5248|nr:MULTISPECIES: alcohol dehydrogenase catalytic domain-containing protein [unclassified Cohnella]OXS58854.1 galactitol-1-phosphate 5-dehydrogenase [Cohnella sp. CIP 111063]PRX71942.1 threonine dehydrogenase-like Zn-dependent dehydrogenase [Cohnella sp. SGD-V74]
MQALVWTAAENMEYTASLDKPVPGENEVLIRVEAVGICGSEIEGYLGHNSLRVPPLVMGHEFCGRIVELGSRAAGFGVGQKAVVNPLSYCGACAACRKGNTQLCAVRRIVGIHRPGAFGEYVAVPASNVIPVPESLDPFRAALAEPLACSLRATRRAMQRHSFANVVVFGAGGIGILCAKTAKLLGAERVIVLDTQDERLDMAAKVAAADVTINPRSADIREEIGRLAGEKGVDVVIDAAGFQPTRSAAMSIVNAGGTIMNIGLGIDDTVLPINAQIRGEVELLGSFCYNEQDFRDAVDLLINGSVTEEGWTEIRPLSTGGDAFRDLVGGRVKSGKIILAMGGEQA